MLFLLCGTLSVFFKTPFFLNQQTDVTCAWQLWCLRFVSDSTWHWSLSWNAISFLRVVFKVSIDAIVNSIFHSSFPFKWWVGGFIFRVRRVRFTHPNQLGWFLPPCLYNMASPQAIRDGWTTRGFSSLLCEKRRKRSWVFPFLSSLVLCDFSCMSFVCTFGDDVSYCILIYICLDIASAWKVPRFQRNFLVMNVVCTWFPRKIKPSLKLT